MFFSVLLCFLVTTLIPSCYTHSRHEKRYECGPHGKFEYCIDDIPGCVIGCHCHPGYYFDTDTKICEPNVKLTQDFRRHYLAEPTRIYTQSFYTPTVTDSIPTLTTTDSIDEKVDEIAKDTDDLGDWLYNQFFKTIENQVINNTNNSDPIKNGKPITRRSGGDSEIVVHKSKRKSRKSMRADKKKKQTKVHGLRRKLLRITEDDSLFDSKSDSDYSDSSSGSDSESDSDTSSESKNDKKSSGEKDHDHGHKKVIIFNRRPRPPLPSFIFLPNMDTPYYPPIGLPPPPLQMYPMVPVPPMAPPIFPFPGPPAPPCDDEQNKITSSTQTATTQAADTTSTAVTTAEPTTAEAHTDETTTETAPEPSTDNITPQGDRRSRLKKHRSRRPMPDEIVPRSREPGNPQKVTHSQRNKLMQKIREKIQGLNKIAPVTSQLSDEFQDAELPIMDEVMISQETFMSSNRTPKKKTRNKIPKLEDVDFKYLSELIHRVNQSDAMRLRPLPFDINDDLKELERIQSHPSRRNYNPYNVEPADVEPVTNQHRNLQRHGADDVYYSNLGRQIASMIRSADSKVNHQINKYAEETNRQVPFHSVLNENSFAPRSFWERSVRSPLSQIRTFNNYLDESRTLKHSNEKALLNLENEVEVFTNTQPPLSLQDLENILSTMQKAHTHIKYRSPMKSTRRSNVSLNVNLLPKYVKTDFTKRRLLNAPDNVEYEYVPPLTPRNYLEMQTINASSTTVVYEQNTEVPLHDYWMYNHQNVRPISFTQTNKPVVLGNQIYNTNPTRKTFAADGLSNNNLAVKPRVEYLQFLRNRPVTKRTTTKKRQSKLLTNPPVNYKNLNYFSGVKHHYMFEKASYPLQIASLRQVSKPYGKSMNPTYFHHELHHFDYFD